MRTPKIRHIAAVGALALIAGAPLAACGGNALAPLPAQAASAGPAGPADETASGRPSASTPAAHSPPSVVEPATAPRPARTKTKTTRPGPTPSNSSCFGAIRYDMDLQNTVLELTKSMCFHTGGVLRLQGIGPGLVTATPTSLVSQSYEGGVVDLRFVRPGTVTVTIPQDQQTHTITVVVVG